jgi:hypothetical protein
MNRVVVNSLRFKIQGRDKREELLLPLLLPEVDVKVILALVRRSHLAFEGKMKYAFNRRARERE